MKKVLIYGAGAIGRGFLPWVFRPDHFKYYFVEKNLEIKNLLNSRKTYNTYKTLKNTYDILSVKVEHCFSPGEEIDSLSSYDAIFTALGPRNFPSIIDNFIDKSIPILCFENDSSLPELMKARTNNKNVVFCIPDVITSNTATPDLLNDDPLSIITADGECFVDKKVNFLGGNCKYISKKELDKQWKAKLYIHNTTHCIAAYFGNIVDATYLHESMLYDKIISIVEGSMNELKDMLIKKYSIDRSFLDFYEKKELDRFKNKLLFDPISRVAREPFRKLSTNERLIGAANLCLSKGVLPKNIIKGIMAAFSFERDSDNDYYIKYLIRSLPKEDFLRIIIGLRQNEALYELIVDNWDDNIEIIKEIKNEKRKNS